MPNRIIREAIINSLAVNQLSDEEEVFFRRLLSIVDDYGRAEAHPALLRAHLYALKLEAKPESKITAYLRACEQHGLVILYAIEGKAFLQVQKFGQQVRSKSKYPPPPDSSCAASDAQLLINGQAHAEPLPANAHLDVSVSVSEGVSVAEGVTRSRGKSRSDKSVLPKDAGEPLGSRMLALNAIFNRRESTRWPADDITALKNAGLHEMPAAQFREEVDLITAFYRATIPPDLQKKFWRRTELIRVLRHWSGELDRAQAWADWLHEKLSREGEGRL